MSLSLEDRNEVAEIAARAAGTMLREARGGKLPGVDVRPGVVTSGGVVPGDVVVLAMDGDVGGGQTYARNTTGKPLFGGERVLVTFAPPHGAFVTHSYSGVVPAARVTKLSQTIATGTTPTNIAYSTSGSIDQQQGGIELVSDQLVVSVRGVYGITGYVVWPLWALVTADKNFYSELAVTDGAGTVTASVLIHGDNDYDGAQQSVYQNPVAVGYRLEAGEGVILRCVQQTGVGQDVASSLRVVYLSDTPDPDGVT